MNSSDRKKRFLSILFFTFGAVLAFGAAQSKLLNITLAELVNRSDLIAYGKASADVGMPPSKVIFRVQQVLKGEASLTGNDVVLCNNPDDVESYDLRTMESHFIVFASKKWRCYKPVHGASSVIEVSDGTALTSSIIDEPIGQSFNEVTEKIRALKK